MGHPSDLHLKDLSLSYLPWRRLPGSYKPSLNHSRVFSKISHDWKSEIPFIVNALLVGNRFLVTCGTSWLP